MTDRSAWVRAYQGAKPDDLAVLGAIQARVLVLHGSDTAPSTADIVRHVAGHVPSARCKRSPAQGTPLR